jgi:5'-3' exonuclease
MGVPRIFQWIVKKYPNTFLKGKFPDNKTCSYLCYDVNGLLHPCVRKSIMEKGKFDIADIRKQIKEKMNELAAICKPTKGIFICIDGVAPVAKMMQQRYRRYKSVYEKQVEKKIYEKHNIPAPFVWDTNALTPSTEFMEQVNLLFKEIAKEMGEMYPSCEVFYSDSNEYGEGEHKIMTKLRTVEYKEEDSIFIHGLDADLIFLSIGLEKDNIFLMRENDPSIGYLDISSLKEKLFLEIQSLAKNILEQKCVEKDFMVISYFLGNDFLPQVFSCDVMDLSKLLSIYANIIDSEKKYLVFDGKIQWSVVEKLCGKLSESEYYSIKHRVKKYVEMRISDDEFDNAVDKEIFWNKQRPHVDYLKLAEPGWKDRLYKYYFDFMPTSWNEKNAMVLNFLEGLQWNLNYYLSGVKNWMWNYRYHAAPLFGDIFHYLQKRGVQQLEKNCFYVGKDTNKPSNIEQLLVVLPPQSIHLIPQKYKFLMTDYIRSPIIDLFPIGYDLEFYYKQRDWEYKPKLPDLDFHRIVNAVKEIK